MEASSHISHIRWEYVLTHTILSACKYLKYYKINLTRDAVFSITSILIKVSKQQEIFCQSQAKD